MFQKKKKLDRGVGGWRLANPNFSWIFFNLTKPLSKHIYLNRKMRVPPVEDDRFNPY